MQSLIKFFANIVILIPIRIPVEEDLAYPAIVLVLIRIPVEEDLIGISGYHPCPHPYSSRGRPHRQIRLTFRGPS
jgi:hypothetical protein